jgi:hypothetical protein
MTEKGVCNTEKSEPDSKTQFTVDCGTTPFSDDSEYRKGSQITHIIGICADCKEYKGLTEIVTLHQVTKRICKLCKSKYTYNTSNKNENFHTGAKI